MSRRILPLLLALMTAFPALGSGLAAEDVWVRATPPGAKTAAMYLTVSNHSPAPVFLTGATTEVADRGEVHEHIHEDGMMRMQQVARLEIPTRGTQTLEPGGYHMMLIGLKQSLTAGDKLQISLTFEGGQQLDLLAPIIDGRR